MPLLIGLLRQTEARRTMVFVNTRRMAERLESVAASANGFHAQALSGDVPQNEAPAVPARLPRGRARGADRDRRRLARAAHPRRQPRLQLRPAAGCARLRASHRPHRARRRRRRCHQLRLRGIRGLAARHRGLHRPQDPVAPIDPDMLATGLAAGGAARSGRGGACTAAERRASHIGAARAPVTRVGAAAAGRERLGSSRGAKRPRRSRMGPASRRYMGRKHGLSRPPEPSRRMIAAAGL